MAPEEEKKSYKVIESYQSNPDHTLEVGDVVELTDSEAIELGDKVSLIEEDKSVLKKYKVIGEITPCTPEGESLPNLEIDSIQEVPESLGSEWVEKGLAEEVKEEEIETNEGPELKEEASKVDEDEEFKNGIAAENHVG